MRQVAEVDFAGALNLSLMNGPLINGDGTAGPGDMRVQACEPGTMADANAWYYCLTHQTVEKGVGCKGADRMGPYPDEATAGRALEIARERTRAADEKAKEWDGD